MAGGVDHFHVQPVNIPAVDAVALFFVTLLQMFLPPIVAVLVFVASAVGGLWLVEELSAK